jgi:hypothetical protein
MGRAFAKTRPLLSLRGRIRAKGSSNGEKSGHIFNSILVAVGSKLVQEGEEDWTGRRFTFCLFLLGALLEMLSS